MCSTLKRLFYNFPQNAALIAVEESIYEFGDKILLKEHGASAQAFSELVCMCMASLFVERDGIVYTQRDGICIGSCIAPLTSDLYMAKGDRSLRNELEALGISVCFDKIFYCVACSISSGQSM